MTPCSFPALYYAKQDRDRGLLSEGDAQFVGQATRDILDVLAHDAPALAERSSGSTPTPIHRPVSWPVPSTTRRTAWVSRWCDTCSTPRGTGWRCAGTGCPWSKCSPGSTCAALRSSASGPSRRGSESSAISLQAPALAMSQGLKIVVGRWGLHDEMDADCQQLLAAGADHVETTVLDTQRTLVRLALASGHPARSRRGRLPEIVPGRPRRRPRRSGVPRVRNRRREESRPALCPLLCAEEESRQLAHVAKHDRARSHQTGGRRHAAA